MKKRLLAIMAAGIALSAGVTTAFVVGSNGRVANAETNGALNNSGNACVFVDEDGDGVCDNKGTNQGNGNCGKNFIDEDGDGVCDNKGTCQGCGNGAGKSNGCGNGGRRGSGNHGGGCR